MNTPSGLNTNDPQVHQALGDAVNDLRSNGIPLDASLRAHQYEMRGNVKIPIHGGPGTDGLFNAINVLWTPPVGYPNVPHGSSFVMVTQFRRKGCPSNRSILTYSLSVNPNSPYFADQTKMFSKKQWVDPPFCADQVRRRSRVATVLGPNGVIRRGIHVRRGWDLVNAGRPTCGLCGHPIDPEGHSCPRTNGHRPPAP